MWNNKCDRQTDTSLLNKGFYFFPSTVAGKDSIPWLPRERKIKRDVLAWWRSLAADVLAGWRYHDVLFGWRRRLAEDVKDIIVNWITFLPTGSRSSTWIASPGLTCRRQASRQVPRLLKLKQQAPPATHLLPTPQHCARSYESGSRTAARPVTTSAGS